MKLARSVVLIASPLFAQQQTGTRLPDRFQQGCIRPGQQYAICVAVAGVPALQPLVLGPGITIDPPSTTAPYYVLRVTAVPAALPGPVIFEAQYFTITQALVTANSFLLPQGTNHCMVIRSGAQQLPGIDYTINFGPPATLSFIQDATHVPLVAGDNIEMMCWNGGP